MTPTPEAYEAVIDAVRQSTPCVILDMPHGWPPWIKACLLAADEIVIVATPDLASLAQRQEHDRAGQACRAPTIRRRAW